MKYFSIIILALLVSSCGWVDRVGAYASGYTTQCIKGVMYVQFASGASVMYEPSGKIVVCKE